MSSLRCQDNLPRVLKVFPPNSDEGYESPIRFDEEEEAFVDLRDGNVIPLSRLNMATKRANERYFYPKDGKIKIHNLACLARELKQSGEWDRLLVRFVKPETSISSSTPYVPSVTKSSAIVSSSANPKLAADLSRFCDSQEAAKFQRARNERRMQLDKEFADLLTIELKNQEEQMLAVHEAKKIELKNQLELLDNEKSHVQSCRVRLNKLRDDNQVLHSNLTHRQRTNELQKLRIAEAKASLEKTLEILKRNTTNPNK